MTKLSKGYLTLAEHHAEMKANGTWDAYVELGRKRDEEHAQRVEAERIALIPLTEELSAAGCSLSSSGDLTNQPNISTAIPILFTHLQRTTYPPDARSAIAFALSGPEVKPYWELLLRLYRDERDESVKMWLINGILNAADKETFEDVLALIRDKSLGPTRGVLLITLNKSKDPRGHATIEELADDPDLREEIEHIRKRWARNAIKRAERQAQKNPTRH